MGQLATALRDPQWLKAIEEEGVDLDYTDGFEMLGDMVALRRVFPDATLLGYDNPLEQRVGFLAYWMRGGEEIVVYFGMDYTALQSIRPDDETRVNLLTDKGRVTILRLVEQEAAKPVILEDDEHLPEDDEHLPSIWERLMADDDED